MAACAERAWGNLLLHQGLELSGSPALMRVVLEAEWPQIYDPAFFAWVAVTAPGAAVLWRLMHTRSRLTATSDENG